MHVQDKQPAGYVDGACSDFTLGVLQYKDRIDKNLIKPAVNFRETGSRSATMKAAVSS